MARPKNPTDPLPGLAPWVGGKRNLATRLAERIAAVPHHTYAEPFVGMGGVFFRRLEAAPCEVINDRSGEVVNIFRVVRHHPAAFTAELALWPFARDEFERQLKVDPATLTDVQRAARFYLLQRSAFSGSPISRSFAVTPRRNKAIHPDALVRHVHLAHRRLAKVTIENLDFGAFLERYDTPATLFYLDPPYWERERIYGKGLFERADFARLSDALQRLQARFVMSLNDVPQVRELFAWAAIEEVTTTYKFHGTKQVTELVISSPRKRRSNRP